MSMDSSEVAEEEEEDRIPCSGFRVKYLGCATFTRKRGRRLPKGISSMQRPLLEVYAGARKRGESHRSAHLLALDQRLDVLDYGLVVAQNGSNSSRTEEDLVLIKVLTPLSNAVLWAAVRFQARALRKRVFGAAFVPIACCDGVLDRKGYLRLDSKHRFLVSLSHPSVFACVFRRVSDPRSFECHAFACSTAREALALGSAMSMVRGRCDLPPVVRTWPPQPPPPSVLRPRSIDTDETRTSSDLPLANGQRRRIAIRRPADRPREQKRFPSRLLPPRVDTTEEESNSYASVHKSPNSRLRQKDKVPSSNDLSQWRLVQVAGRSPDPSFFPLETPSGNGGPPSSAYSYSQLTSDADYSTTGHDIKNIDPCDLRADSGVEDSRRDVCTMTDFRQQKGSSGLLGDTEELVQTIDLSSESTDGGSTRRFLALPLNKTTPGTGSSSNAAPVKYTYFGYETFRAPTSDVQASQHHPTTIFDNSEDNKVEVPLQMGYLHSNKLKYNHHDHSGPENRSRENQARPKDVAIQGNGTGKVTINVPFSKQDRRNGSSGRSSSASTQTDVSHIVDNSRTVLLPVRGVRTFRSDRRVGDWSTLSQSTSDDASCLGSVLQHPRPNGPPSSMHSSAKYRNRHRQRPRHQQQQQTTTKVLRWCSEDRLPTQRSKSHYHFFWSLKRLSLQSLTKAKHKTGKFISSVRTKLLGPKKSPESSEDSAYDTSEVCLSPNGRTYSCTEINNSISKQGGTKARRQQSWSFHDLRMATAEKQRLSPTPFRQRFRNDSPSAKQTSSMKEHSKKQTVNVTTRSSLPQQKRRTRRHKLHRRRPSSSDSGVDEYPSDGSAMRRSESDGTDTNRRVTRVQVHHGMSTDTFQRWSHTNLQDELGYIP